jgi:hypothetical protein
MTTRTVDGVKLTRIDGGWSWPGGRFDFIHATDLDDAAGWRVLGGVAALVIGMAFVVFTPQQPLTPPQRSTVTSVPSPNAGTIVVPSAPVSDGPPLNT